MPPETKPEKPLPGQRWILHDGSEVQIFDKVGDAWKVINSRGKMDVVYESQIASRARG